MGNLVVIPSILYFERPLMKHNGYVLCKGKMLKDFKLHFAHEIDCVSKTTQLVEKGRI